MKLQECTYEQAKKLKALGFNEYTLASYMGREYCGYIGWKNSDKVYQHFPNHGNLPPMLSAPSIALALKWLRDTKKIMIFIDKAGVEFEYISELPGLIIEDTYDTGTFPTYEKAESRALDGVLDYLIRMEDRKELSKLINPDDVGK